MDESIFKLIESHSAVKKGSLLPQHVALHAPTHDPEEDPHPRVSKLRANGPIRDPEEDPVPRMPHGASKPRTGAQAQNPPSKLQPRAVSCGLRGASSTKEEEPAEVVARRRQLAQMRGTEMAAALAPGRDNIRVKMAQAGMEVRDHASEYKSKVKEQSVKNAFMKAQGEVPQAKPAARRPEFSGNSRNVEPGETNYVVENMQRGLEHAAKLQAASSSKVKPAKYAGPDPGRVPGRIPKYLVERKIEMEVEKAIADEEEERKKGGPKAMPEEERLATLTELNNQKKAALHELNCIPISKTQLPVYQAQIKKLEARLTEIDNAVILFSRKVVYVQ